MSQLPQNNEEFDYNPEYAKLYQGNDSLQADADDTDNQLQRVSELPLDVQREQDGKKAANFSLLLGLLAPPVFILGFRMVAQYPEGPGLLLAIGAPLLNILGIWQGFVARRHGVRAIGGLVLNGLGLCFFIGIVALILLIASALSGIH